MRAVAVSACLIACVGRVCFALGGFAPIMLHLPAYACGDYMKLYRLFSVFMRCKGDESTWSRHQAMPRVAPRRRLPCSGRRSAPDWAKRVFPTRHRRFQVSSLSDSITILLPYEDASPNGKVYHEAGSHPRGVGACYLARRPRRTTGAMLKTPSRSDHCGN